MNFKLKNQINYLK